MKRYTLFYCPDTLGDVLLILFDIEASVTHYERHRDIVLIYHDDRLIGVNVFNIQALVKIHAHGIIYNPPPVLIQIINDKFSNEAIDVYLPRHHSGYHIAEVMAVQPQENHQFIITLNDGLKQIRTLTHIPTIIVGQRILVIQSGTLLPDGTLFKTVTEEMPMMIANQNMIAKSGRSDLPFVINDNLKPGDDYFQWE